MREDHNEQSRAELKELWAQLERAQWQVKRDNDGIRVFGPTAQRLAQRDQHDDEVQDLQRRLRQSYGVDAATEPTVDKPVADRQRAKQASYRDCPHFFQELRSAMTRLVDQGEALTRDTVANELKHSVDTLDNWRADCHVDWQAELDRAQRPEKFG